MELIATVARGLEAVLADELTDLGATRVEPTAGVVRFEGELEQAYRACLWARSASRILLPVSDFGGEGEQALYEGVHAIDWLAHLGPAQTLAVDCVTARGVRGHTRYLAQLTKDAICDRIREREGARPSVDRTRPDLRVHVHVARERTRVSLDLAGEAMHRRGYRGPGGEAPLKENLAAGLLLHAGWPAQAAAGRPLLDPLCGSGTLLLEAALIARDVAPGLLREHHGMAGWRGHDRGLWTRLLEEARARRDEARARPVRIVGHDAAERPLAAARRAASRLRVEDAVRVSRASLAQVRAPASEPGLLVTNPPYGQRLGAESELLPLYEQLGDLLKRHLPGWTGWVLTGSPALARRIGLRPASRLIVHNGPIECRFLELPIREAARDGQGPRWRKPSAEASAFDNRLRKNVRHFGRWARRREIECYRVYDADIPEYNVAIDRYGDHVVVQEYSPPASVDADAALGRVRDVLLVTAEVLEVPAERVVLKVRRRQVQGEQYQRGEEDAALLEVGEGGHRFLVSPSGHQDTGLFPDHRQLRAIAAEHAVGRSFLNLFAYTCSASVYARRAGSLVTVNVDLSGTYLERGRDNFRLNRLDPAVEHFVQQDVLHFLRQDRRRYGVIYLNPPSYSRSHRMDGDLDIKRDHAGLIRLACERLEPDGVLLFSTHARDFELDPALARELEVEDISRRSVPDDYRRSPHRSFKIRRP
ncbi:MAG: bifunctional 23S rRNA (guanine(2069)-N(7))-methyltransferase RlmK/23S rRNA (guanine(2445)-N(2))-methyltransferase RlmL [Myxococcales bacterium]|nr:bifunctional 23S rRNA (guanine(2069)-N(7))-methyltransferase RlmK/23S rRNA (guanine(2445)-N(2))-methyltransferase RlmL [Myxococcales bacterium]